MTFTFNDGIPAANNNPSVDQPDMLSNNVSTNGILAVDHISFNAPNGGTHKQVTFIGKNVPGAQTDPTSVLYTNSGTASSVADLFFRSQNGIFQVIPIKAWGLCNVVGGVVTIATSVNVTSVVRSAKGKYVVTLTANATIGTNFAVLVSCTITTVFADATDCVAGYVITGANQFQLNFINLNAAFNDPASFSFQVMQI